MDTLGFVGLGHMGGNMAARYLAAGYTVSDDRVLESVASGDDGIIAGLSDSKIWIDMSTVSPRASRDVAEQVRKEGASMLDAPVSGSVPQVQTGTLTIMVGGAEQAYARV